MVPEFREEFPDAVEEFIDDTLDPYEKFIPLGIAVGPFMSLVSITRLLAWPADSSIKACFLLAYSSPPNRGGE